MGYNKLSFCIPTYNRADFINHTLTSIADQIIEGHYTDIIEICVSDNASTDGTDKVINSFKNKYPLVQVVYSKSSENLGADKNYLKVVELASGEYCWLMGSDDALVPEAISRILSEIEHAYDIYLCNRIDCTYSLQPVRKFNWLNKTADRLFDFTQRGEIVDYFNRSRSIGAVFSYLSSIIVKRSAWRSVSYDSSMTGTAYSHAYILVSLIANGAKLKYLQDAMVFNRTGNDSFAQDGELKRFLLDIDGYSKIANKLFNNEEVKSAFLKIMTREQPWNRLSKVKYFNREKWQEIRYRLNGFGYSRLTLACVEMMGSIPYLVGLMVKSKRKFYRNGKLGW